MLSRDLQYIHSVALTTESLALWLKYIIVMPTVALEPSAQFSHVQVVSDKVRTHQVDNTMYNTRHLLDVTLASHQKMFKGAEQCQM